MGGVGVRRVVESSVRRQPVVKESFGLLLQNWASLLGVSTGYFTMNAVSRSFGTQFIHNFKQIITLKYK
jgi:nitrate reductase gamma subunit